MQLIKEVEARPAIWCRGHNVSNRVYSKAMLWQEIASKLNVNRLAAESKFANLRRHFNLTKHIKYSNVEVNNAKLAKKRTKCL